MKPATDRSALLALVRECLADVLAARGTAAADIAEDTVLVGQGARLDSLGLVTLIVDVEQRIGDEAGVRVTLADERAMSAAKSPFRTVGSLVDHALGQIGARS